MKRYDFNKLLKVSGVVMGMLLLAGSQAGWTACKVKTMSGNAFPDVAGNYELIHSDQVTVQVKVGGVVKTSAGAEGDVVEVGGVTVDLGKLCARPEVHCPSEVLWDQVAIHQPKYPNNPFLMQMINLDSEAFQIQKGGLLNGQGNFLLGLGFKVATGGPCAGLALSAASGNFEKDLSGALTGTIVNGKVTVAYAGACLFPNDDGMIGATITITSNYTAHRVGDFALPETIEKPPITDPEGNPIP